MILPINLLHLEDEKSGERDYGYHKKAENGEKVHLIFEGERCNLGQVNLLKDETELFLLNILYE